MNRRDFLKTAAAGLCGAVSACVGWSRVSASSWSSEHPTLPGANWSSGPAQQPNTFRVIGPQTGGWRDMGMTDTKDDGFTMTMTHIDETLRGMPVPFEVVGDGHITLTLIDGDGETEYRFYLPQVNK